MNEGTLKVAQIADKQAQTAPACRFKLNCTMNGFPIELEGEGPAVDLKLIVDRLVSIGAERPQAAKLAPTKAAGVPQCPVHGTEMKSGRRGFFCPKKVGDGYCKEVA